MPPHTLVCHANSPSTAIERIEVAIEPGEHDWRLSYRLIGDAHRVVAEAPSPDAPPMRRDGLWRSTCCELFVRSGGGDEYVEFNFAPCGDWAAYRFSAYRAGRASLETPAPRIALARSSGAIEVTVTLNAPALDGVHKLEPRMGLACVVAADTGISYWALAHPPGTPDFHHAASFALRSPAIRRTAQSNA